MPLGLESLQSEGLMNSKFYQEIIKQSFSTSVCYLKLERGYSCNTTMTQNIEANNNRESF